MKKSVIFFIASAFFMHILAMENPDHSRDRIVRVGDGPIVLTINNQTNKEYNVNGDQINHIISSGQTIFSGLELKVRKNSFGTAKIYYICPMQRMPTGKLVAQNVFASETIRMDAVSSIDYSSHGPNPVNIYSTTHYLIKASIANYYIGNERRAELRLLAGDVKKKIPCVIYVLLAGENQKNSDIALSTEAYKAKIQ